MLSEKDFFFFKLGLSKHIVNADTADLKLLFLGDGKWWYLRPSHPHLKAKNHFSLLFLLTFNYLSSHLMQLSFHSDCQQSRSNTTLPCISKPAAYIIPGEGFPQMLPPTQKPTWLVPLCLSKYHSQSWLSSLSTVACSPSVFLISVKVNSILPLLGSKFLKSPRLLSYCRDTYFIHNSSGLFF